MKIIWLVPRPSDKKAKPLEKVIQDAARFTELSSWYIRQTDHNTTITDKNQEDDDYHITVFALEKVRPKINGAENLAPGYEWSGHIYVQRYEKSEIVRRISKQSELTFENQQPIELFYFRDSDVLREYKIPDSYYESPDAQEPTVENSQLGKRKLTPELGNADKPKRKRKRRPKKKCSES